MPILKEVGSECPIGEKKFIFELDLSVDVILTIGKRGARV